MPRLKQKLLKALENAKRVAILGIGSELRGDDAVGLLVLKHLQEKALVDPRILSHFIKSDQSAVRSVAKSPPAGPVLKLFYGGTAPENLTGEIRRFRPDHLIMIDAVELGKRPGTVELVDLKKTANTAFLTHKLPVKLMLDYLAFARMPHATETNGKSTSAKPNGRRRVASEMSFTTIFIGIQPRSLEFEGKISRPVSRAGRELADWLTAAFNASAKCPCFSDDKRRTNSPRR